MITNDPYSVKLKRTYNNYVDQNLENRNLPTFKIIKSVLFNLRMKHMPKDPKLINNIPKSHQIIN